MRLSSPYLRSAPTILLRATVKGWDSAQPKTLAHDPVQLLNQLDGIWDRPSSAVVEQIESAANSNDALIRQAAAEVLGRLAMPSTAASLARLLGDPSKLVQRTAAWSLRQIYTRHPDTAAAYLLSALSSEDARVRWGATRVFAHHFSVLAQMGTSRRSRKADVRSGYSHPARSSSRSVAGLVLERGRRYTRSRIEDTILAGLGHPEYPWIEENLRAAVYNLADENIRYLYNNWVPLLGQRRRPGPGHSRTS